MGETKLLNGISPFLRIIERSGRGVSMVDGAVSNNRNVIGTYVHGILDNDEFRLGLINYLRENKGISPLLRNELIIAKREKEEQYNRLADLVRKHIKMDLIYKYIN
jgi:adenosylcobyric acid synthase